MLTSDLTSLLQVVLMLTSDLDSEEKDKAALDALLTALLSELRMTDREQPGAMHCRTLNYEVQLVIMRLLSVLMSRTKAGTKPSAEVHVNGLWEMGHGTTLGDSSKVFFYHVQVLTNCSPVTF